jgi:XTP/dITP diphosphohydrolase
MIIESEVPGRRLQLLIATTNRGKLAEIHSAFGGLPITVRRLDEFPDILPVEEVSETYQQNATLKALCYSRQTGLFALADDSGLEVDALEGGPGPLSARFGGELSDTQRNQKLLSVLAPYPMSKRTARFVCSMVFAGWPLDEAHCPEADPRVLAVTEGTCEGNIADGPRGHNGFGFDPVFVPSRYKYTFAELSSQIKNEISHRAKALAAMRLFLESWLSKLDR